MDRINVGVLHMTTKNKYTKTLVLGDVVVGELIEGINPNLIGVLPTTKKAKKKQNDPQKRLPVQKTSKRS